MSGREKRLAKILVVEEVFGKIRRVEMLDLNIVAW
jgi:hypothetical protein